MFCNTQRINRTQPWYDNSWAARWEKCSLYKICFTVHSNLPYNRNSLVKSPQDEDPDEGVRDLVELALRKMDYDRDGKISFQDFKSSVTEEPLLLEAFGQCLPADTACQTFLSTLQCWISADPAHKILLALILIRWSTMYVNKSVLNVSVVISCTDKNLFRK